MMKKAEDFDAKEYAKKVGLETVNYLSLMKDGATLRLLVSTSGSEEVRNAAEKALQRLRGG